MDLKLKNYSSGMHVRLAFSVMIQVGADIMLVDEILAVGDASFQQKCFDVFFQMRDEGKTVLFVTHDMAAVQRFCHRAMLLERGKIVAIGAPEEVADRYLELNFEGLGEASGNGPAGARAGDGAARVVGRVDRGRARGASGGAGPGASVCAAGVDRCRAADRGPGGGGGRGQRTASERLRGQLGRPGRGQRPLRGGRDARLQRLVRERAGARAATRYPP